MPNAINHTRYARVVHPESRLLANKTLHTVVATQAEGIQLAERAGVAALVGRGLGPECGLAILAGAVPLSAVSVLEADHAAGLLGLGLGLCSRIMTDTSKGQ